MPSFEQRNNKWSVRFRGYENNTEKNMRLSGFKTKREARIAYEEWVAKHPFVKTDKSVKAIDSFNELAREYLESKKHRVEDTTLEAAESRVRNHILPYFGEMKPDEITVEDIEKWQDYLSEKNLSYNTKKGVRSQLKQILDLGKRRYKIASAFGDAESIRNKDKKKEMQVWSEAEFAQFLSAVDDPTYRAFFHFLYATGCRRGEAQALTKQDVGVRKDGLSAGKQDFEDGKQDFDEDAQYIRINKNMADKKGDDRRVWFVKSTKTDGSNRFVWVSKELIEELLSVAGEKFVFEKDGEPITKNALRFAFDKCIKLSGVKPIVLHDLRHSHASLLISKGIPITAVSKRLGHSKVSITLDTYAHLMPIDEQRVRDAVKFL